MSRIVLLDCDSKEETCALFTNEILITQVTSGSSDVDQRGYSCIKFIADNIIIRMCIRDNSL